MDDYHHNIESGITRTMLSTFATSRRLFEAIYIERIIPHETSDALVFGQLVHALVLEPMENWERFQVWADEFGPRRGKKWEAFKQVAEADGRTVITQKQHDEAQKMAESLRRSIGHLVSCGVKEQEYSRLDEQSGLNVKCRCDLVVDGEISASVIDIKTTQDETTQQFPWSIKRYGYDWQDVHYSFCVEPHFHKPVNFLFAAVRKSPPWTVQLFDLSDERREKARRDWRNAMNSLAECLNSGDFRNEFEGKIYEVT